MNTHFPISTHVFHETESDTVILLFEPGRICFVQDLIDNSCRMDAQSQYSGFFVRTLVETDVRVRSKIAVPKLNLTL